MRKGLLIIGAIAIVLATVPMFAAFEAHVINVTAHIENALLIIPPGDMTFGTVFPQEYREKSFWITTSDSFSMPDQRRVLTFDYKIVQKPKCECDSTEYSNLELCPEGQHAKVGYDTHECPSGYTAMPSLCPYLSKTPVYEDDPPYTDYGVPAFHDPEDPANVATGTIDKDFDKSDEWILDLAVPCFRDHCSQDWPAFVAEHNDQVNPDDYILPFELEGKDFGCDLWVEVTDIYSANVPRF